MTDDLRPIGGMRQRVRCVRCTAHRDLAIAPTCLVCGCVAHLMVTATPGDLETDPITKELVTCAELVDTAIHDRVVLDPTHPIAKRLAAACRARALSLAGQ
jgi:hypothetical protein